MRGGRRVAVVEHNAVDNAERGRLDQSGGGDFKRAWEAKDIGALIGLLDPDCTAVGDGGGLASAELHPIAGGERVARYCLEIAGRTPNLTILERTVNGQPGLVAQQDGVTVTVIALEVTGDRIKHIWAVRNPEKLRPWTTH